MPLPLIEGKTITKKYGLQLVLDDLSFLVAEKQKVALIGRNGAGKSTLLKIITGAEEADSGEIRFFPNAHVGVVEQHQKMPGDVSSLVYLETKSGKPEWEIRKKASAFALTSDHLAQPPATLSGGYQMRIKLLAMFLNDPNILLLDEPVNYLDLQTQLLLERFLQSYKGACLIAAHDRTFLQNTCTHTFEIERGKLTSYGGPVDEYLEFKEEQKEYERKHNKKMAREIAHQQEFVDRFRYKASKASQAQSKIKHIAKLRTKISTINAALATTKITIPSPFFVPGYALRIKELCIGYGEVPVAEDIGLEIQRGEKVVFAGENGRGKSTLMKTLAGKIPALGGTYAWWPKADIGSFDQHTEAMLKPEETVLHYLSRMAPATAASERILMMAGNFLFRNDDLDKPASVLSGGERARLCLAGVLLHEHNVLLLDEPTNHLDVETVEALAVALKEYTGTVILISHARTFVNTLADRVFEIRGGRVREHIGTYEEYVSDVSELMSISLGGEDESSSHASGTSLNRAEIHRRIKDHQRSLERTNQRMKQEEEERDAILHFFFENPTEYAPEKATRLAELRQNLERDEREWFRDSEAVEELRRSIG